MFYDESVSLSLCAYKAILIAVTKEISRIPTEEILPQTTQHSLSDVVSEDNDRTIGSLNYMSLAIVSEEELKSQCLNVIDVAVNKSKVSVEGVRVGISDANIEMEDNYDKRLTDLVGFINSFIGPLLKETHYLPSQIKHITTSSVNSLEGDTFLWNRQYPIDRREEDPMLHDLIRATSTLSGSQMVDDVCLSSSQESNLLSDTFTDKDMIMVETYYHATFEENCQEINVETGAQEAERALECSQLEEKIARVQLVDFRSFNVCELYHTVVLEESPCLIISNFIFSSSLVLTAFVEELYDASIIVVGRLHSAVSENTGDNDIEMRPGSGLGYISTKDLELTIFQRFPLTFKRLLLSDCSSSVMEIANRDESEMSIESTMLFCDSDFGRPSSASFFNTIEQTSRVMIERIEECKGCDRGVASLCKEKYRRTCICQFLKSVFKAMFCIKDFKFVIDDAFMTHLLDVWLVPALEDMRHDQQRSADKTESTRSHPGSTRLTCKINCDNNSSNMNELMVIAHRARRSAEVVRPAYHEMFLRNPADGIGIKYLLNIMLFVEELVVTWSGDIQMFDDVLPFLFRVLDQLQSVLLYLAKKVNEVGLMEVCTSCIKDILLMNNLHRCPLCLLFVFNLMLHHVNQFGNFIFQHHFIRTRLSYSLYKVYRSYKNILDKHPENFKSSLCCTFTDRRMKSIQNISKSLLQIKHRRSHNNEEITDILYSSNTKDIRLRSDGNLFTSSSLANRDGIRSKHHNADFHHSLCVDLGWPDFKCI